MTETRDPYVTTDQPAAQGPASGDEPTAPSPFPVEFRDPQALLRDQIGHVMAARATLKALAGRVQQLEDQFRVEHSAILRAVEDARQELAGRESVLRAVTVELFLLTGDKHPHPGVSIREVTRVRYPQDQALAWARDRRLFLKLDAGEFERFARDHRAEVPFVEVTTEPQATIATELSRSLEVRP